MTLQVKCRDCETMLSFDPVVYHKRYKLRKREALCDVCKKRVQLEGAAKAKITRANWSEDKKQEVLSKISEASKRMWNDPDSDYREKMANYQDNWSDEKRASVRAKQSAAQYNRWANTSEEDKQKHMELLRASSKEYYDSLTPEEWEQRNERVRQALANMTPEQKQQHSERCSAATSNYYANISEEEKAARYEKAAISHQAYWDNLSEEERAIRGQQVSQGIANMTDEEKARRSLNSSIATKEYMASLTEEEKAERAAKISEANVKRFENMSDEECRALRINQTAGRRRVLSKSEVDFINELHKSNIKFEVHYYSTKVHPDFNTLFPKNPITGGTVFSTKEWDFIIRTMKGDVLVDVDGSIHSEKNTHTCTRNGVTYKLLDEVKFQESQRPYQTDGLNAYSIRCYDDKLSDDTQVVDVKDMSKMMSFKAFMAMLQFDNMSEKEQKEVASTSNH